MKFATSCFGASVEEGLEVNLVPEEGWNLVRLFEVLMVSVAISVILYCVC